MLASLFTDYGKILNNFFCNESFTKLESLNNEIISVYENNGQIYLCGNGGSATNSIHIANDFCHIRTNKFPRGIPAKSLNENSALITCYANDIDYDSIFSEQVNNFMSSNDMLIVLSGSGNSKNIIKAINTCKNKKIKTWGILGNDGGKSKIILDNYLLTNTSSMQISEDIQTIVFHIITKFIKKL